MTTPTDDLGQLIARAEQLISALTSSSETDHARDTATFQTAYQLGYAAGHHVGYSQAEHETIQAWAHAAAGVHRLNRTPTHIELEQRRWGGRREQFGQPRPGDYPGGPIDWHTGTPLPPTPEPADPWATLPPATA